MKKGLTELVVIIDKSGSMHGLEKDVVGGFNSLIEDQKKQEGETLVTLVLFNHHSSKVYDRVNVKDIKEMTRDSYAPGGCTALLDALGSTISSVEKNHKELKDEYVPEHTIFSIMTDGLENASVVFTNEQIKKMVEAKKEEGWDFIYQAANIDAFAEGNKLGISKEDIESFTADNVGVKMCMFNMCYKIADKKNKIK